MTPAANARFGVGKGRERPRRKAKDIHCPSCGAGLTLKSEASELVVCGYCGDHLDVGEPELEVLGKGAQKKWAFPFNLGDSYREKGVRYEVLARIAYIEDDDLAELTREYYLYHPAHGAMWLSEYKGDYSVSRPSHVALVADPTKKGDNPFTKRHGARLMTHDNQKWVVEETGVYSLVYVDGALPWIAKLGDRVGYVEGREQGGSGRQLAIQSSGRQLEISIGRQLPLATVGRATGRQDLIKLGLRLAGEGNRRKTELCLFWLVAAALVVNAILWVLCLFSGKEVLAQTFNAEGLAGETLSQPFEVPGNKSVIRIDVIGRGLDNSWMAVDLALLRGEDAVIHTFEEDLSYYHGVERGESWSEGIRKQSRYIELPEAGTYHMLVHATCGTDEEPEACKSSVHLKVDDAVYLPRFFIYGFAASVVLLFVVAQLVTRKN